MPLPSEFIERVDVRSAHYLLSKLDAEFFAIHQDEDSEKQSKMANVKKILQAFTRGGGVKKTNYKKSMFDTEGVLRWYVNAGIQQLPSVFRGLLCKSMVDIDMINAHPAILLNLCERYDIPHHYLNEYVEHRDDLIARKQTTKIATLKCLNKGYKQKGTTWFNHFDAEIKSIQKALIPHFPTLWDMATSKDKSNHEGRFLSYVCQFWENQILEHVVSLCPYPVSVLMFDGFMCEGEVPTTYLNDLFIQVQDKFDMNLKWSFKPHNEILSVPDDFEYEENLHCEDDATAAKYVLDSMEGHICEWEGLIYYKNENKWITNQHEIERLVCKYIMSLNIRKLDGKPYSSNTSGTRHIYDALRVNVPTKDIRPILHSSTKYKLCFRNGVLDLRTSVLTPWDDCDDVETTIIIQHDYVSHPTTEVKRRMFSKMFGDDMETGLLCFARALAGHVEDKHWFYYLGSRDCGKGSLFSLLKSAFGDYVKGWNVQSIMYHNKRGADITEISRKLYWLLDHEYTRLAISQEVPKAEMDLKVNGSLLKRLTGGGDEQVVRRNYDTHDQHIILDTTFLVFGNSGLEIDSKDAFDTCVEFSTAFSYKKTQEEIDAEPEEHRHKYILGDSTIKEWVKGVDVINACITLMCESYSNVPHSIIKDRETNDEVKLIDELMSAYLVRSGADAVVLGSDVFDKFKDKKKVKAEFASMGVQYKKMGTKTHRFYTKFCFFGIVDKEDAVDNI